MSRGITLAPCGLADESVETETIKLLISARPLTRTASCPICGEASDSVHSKYQHVLSDSPSQGRSVQIRVHARRFRCLSTDCRRKIFAERLQATITRPFARRLLLPVSNDTLLRVVQRHVAPSTKAPRVVGVDDWAWKRGHRYGTIICNLEQRRIIDILPDREAATVAACLAERPSITIIARDRGAGYR